jgi:5'-nucleotidase
MRKLRIAVDMDEVLADSLGRQLELYNQKYGTQVSKSELHGLELVDIVPSEQQEWVLGMLHEPGFFASLDWIEGAREGISRLCAEHDVYIASAATEFPNSMVEKLVWVEHNIPVIPRRRVIFCGEKSVLDVDYLIDDTPGHFVGLRGVGLLFDAPHNRGDELGYRVKGWGEVPGVIARLEERRR